MIEHVVQGSKKTSTHNFEPTIEGLTITMSPGAYFQAGSVRYKCDEESFISVPSLGDYVLWLTETGFQLKSGYNVPESFIDRLMWFTATDFELENVHFVRVVDTDAS